MGFCGEMVVRRTPEKGTGVGFWGVLVFMASAGEGPGGVGGGWGDAWAGEL